MKLLNNLRYISWYLLELSKKDSIYKRLKSIERIMNDDNEYNQYVNERLDYILNYALDHQKYLSKFNISGGVKLKDFPIVNKNIIINNLSAFQSDEYDHSKLHVKSTSGSTGVPFKVTQNSGKRKQVLAEVLYFSKLMGYKPGKKFIYLRNLESGYVKSKLMSFLQNESVILTRMYDDDTLDGIVKKIANMENETTILGYASTLQAVSSFMEKHDILLNNVSGIISGSETLTSKTRILTQRQFNCPVVSRYSNQEMGILAQEEKEDEFLLNRASYVFEILSLDDDTPVKDGEMGRIVITDLYNTATPLIRYDTGDIGVIETRKNRPYLVKIHGRKSDLLYTTKNQPVSHFAFDDIFKHNPIVEQYQLIQDNRTDITVNIITKNHDKIDEKEYTKLIKETLGEECNVSFKYLETTPISASGKFRCVICNYKPSL